MMIRLEDEGAALRRRLLYSSRPLQTLLNKSLLFKDTHYLWATSFFRRSRIYLRECFTMNQKLAQK